MNEQEEAAYIQGARAAWRRILAEALRGLGGYSDPGDFTRERLIAEREEAISALRSLCREFGDNDWDEKLSLADVIEKHLGRHLHAPHRSPHV